MTKITIGIYVLIIGLSFIMTGFDVGQPVNSSYNCSNSVAVGGYANFSGQLVKFWAWNFDTEEWDQVGSDTASTTSWEWCPERNMYHYAGYADMTDSDYWEFYGGAYYRYLQVTGPFSLSSHETGWFDCYNYRVNTLEETCGEAEEVCKSGDSPVIELYCPSK